MKNEINNSFYFDRELTFKEHLFWSNFFDNFPSDSNSYIQSWIEKYQNLNKLIQNYEEIKKSQSYECLEGNTNYDYFLKSIKKYQQIFPNGKKENHFLMCIYSLCCKDFDIEICRNYIFIPNSPSLQQQNWNKSSMVVALAMCSDLMAGRINDIYPNIQDVNPVFLTGEIKLPSLDSIIMIKIKDLQVEKYQLKNNLFELDFSYSFSKNGDNIKNLFHN